MTPAEKVYKAFDDGERSPQQAISRLSGIPSAEVYRWGKPKTDGGTGGLVPAKWQSTLLRVAKANKIKLNPLDLVNSHA